MIMIQHSWHLIRTIQIICLQMNTYTLFTLSLCLYSCGFNDIHERIKCFTSYDDICLVIMMLIMIWHLKRSIPQGGLHNIMPTLIAILWYSSIYISINSSDQGLKYDRWLWVAKLPFRTQKPSNVQPPVAACSLIKVKSHLASSRHSNSLHLS